MYGYDYEIAEKRAKYAQIRSERLAAARAKGTHTKAEWSALKDVFGCCVICRAPYEWLHGGSPSKDHIVPIYAGGCDCIANIQPACRNCNSGKTEAVDYRSLVRPDWAVQFTRRLEYGWEA